VSDQDGGEQASWDDPLRDAFEARFLPEAFEDIARALDRSTDQSSLDALRTWLLPEFGSFYGSCMNDKDWRARRVTELTKRTKAAADLLASLQSGWFLDQPRDLLNGAFRRKFMEVLEQLADPARIGPRDRYRPKDAFRKSLTPALIWVYEHVTGAPAGKPYSLRYGGGYGGPFYRFACAVQACLHDRLPELRACLPRSDGALAEELQEHWPKEKKSTG
jgi:hypothetical protein